MNRTIAVIIALFALWGCQERSTPTASSSTEHSGQLSLAFDKANAPEAVQWLTTRLSRPGYTTLEKTISIQSDSASAILFESIPVGTWQVKIDAKNSSGTVLFTGESSVTITENSVAQLNLVLTPVPTGVGSVQIYVSWGTAPLPSFPKYFGGSGRDAAITVIRTFDGGYAVGGITQSYGVGGDAWLVKTSSTGKLEWQKYFGGSGEDRINSMVQTNDGGYLIAGYTYGAGEDSWIMKLDTAGVMVWQKNLGLPGDDALLTLKRISDGSFLASGYSSDGTYFDGRIIKFTPSGDIVWTKTFGGIGGDFAMNFVELTNGDIIVSGYTGSNLRKHYDFWLIKVNAFGSTIWEHAYGDSIEERSAGIVLLPNGTLLLSGYAVTQRGQDCILMNIDTTGRHIWTKIIDVGSSDFLIRLQSSPDNTIVAAGYTATGTSGHQGLLMKMDTAGNVKWSKLYGGTGYDVLMEVRVLPDGSIVGAGTSMNPVNKSDDFWLVKTDVNGMMQ